MNVLWNPLKFFNWLSLPGALTALIKLVLWLAYLIIEQAAKRVDSLIANQFPEWDAALANVVVAVNKYLWIVDSFVDVGVIVVVLLHAAVLLFIVRVVRWVLSKVGEELATALVELARGYVVLALL